MLWRFKPRQIQVLKKVRSVRWTNALMVANVYQTIYTELNTDVIMQGDVGVI